MNLLVIESNAFYRQMLVKNFSGSATTAVQNQAEALNAINSADARFDLIITSDELAGSGIMQLYRQIYSLTPQSPFIVLTRDPSKISEYMKSGITFAFEKKSDPVELYEVVRVYLAFTSTSNSQIRSHLNALTTGEVVSRLNADAGFFRFLGRWLALNQKPGEVTILHKLSLDECIDLLFSRGAELYDSGYIDVNQELMDEWLTGRIWGHFSDKQILDCYAALSQSDSKYRDPDLAALFLVYFGNRILTNPDFFNRASAEDQIFTVIQMGMKNFSYFIEYQPSLYFHFKTLGEKYTEAFPREAGILGDLLAPFKLQEEDLKEAMRLEATLDVLSARTLTKLLDADEISPAVSAIMLKRAYHLRFISLQLMESLLKIKGDITQHFRSTSSVLNDFPELPHS